MMERIRAFLAVLEEGSVNRAALRLRITQPALSRQMKALEDEVGGRLLERRTSGVMPTSLGHALAKSMQPVLGSFDTALADLKEQARGLRSELRIGYLISAARSILTPALTDFRKSHPDLTLRLHDMSPREQIEGLRSGELDLALIGQEGAVGAGEYYSRKLCSLRVSAALSDSDPLAQRSRLSLKELRTHSFIGVDETESPGRNRWITAVCRAAGFKPRFAAVVDGISNILSWVASESAATLVPSYMSDFAHPGVKLVPLTDPEVHWDLLVLWQRGLTTSATSKLVEALAEAAQQWAASQK